MDINKTLEERSENYGDYESQSHRCMEIQRALRIDDPKFTDSQRNTLFNISQKLSRLTHGNPHHVDGWHDIGGYSKLQEDIERRLNGEVIVDDNEKLAEYLASQLGSDKKYILKLLGQYKHE